MPTFSSKSHLPTSPLKSTLRRHPFLAFGLPFLSITILSSFVLSELTKTRYEYQDTRLKGVSKEEELGMDKGRKRVDLREEYVRLNNPGLMESSLDALRPSLPSTPPSSTTSSSSYSEPSTPSTPTSQTIPLVPRKPRKNIFSYVSQDELENVRVPRPEGMPEWGAKPVREEELVPVKGRRKEDRWV